MDPTLGMLAGGVIGGAGQLWTNIQNRGLSREQMQFQAAQTAKQMEFIERMSSTAHQREVKDLLAAGLNPMLAFMKGSGGASTPVPTAQGGQTAKMDSSAGAAMASALSVKRMAADIELIEAQRDKVLAEAKTENEFRTERYTGLSFQNDILAIEGQIAQLSRDQLKQIVPLVEKRFSAETAEIVQRTMYLVQQGRMADAHTELLKLGRNEAQVMSDFFESWTGRASPYLNTVRGVVGAGAQAVGAATGVRAVQLLTRDPKRITRAIGFNR